MQSRAQNPRRLRNGAQPGPTLSRADVWRYCVRAAGNSAVQNSGAGLTPHDIDKLFVDQEWRCAISNIPFRIQAAAAGRAGPFSPSLDRIVAGGLYEIGNVRLVCTIVNYAMNEWGEAALYELVEAMAGRDV